MKFMRTFFQVKSGKIQCSHEIHVKNSVEIQVKNFFLCITYIPAISPTSDVTFYAGTLGLWLDNYGTKLNFTCQCTLILGPWIKCGHLVIVEVKYWSL